MDAPTLFPVQEVAPEIFALRAAIPLPGAGVLAVNSFLIRGRTPMLVDCGLPMVKDAFVAALESLIDLADLKRIYLSHADADHLGAYEDILARAPNARVSMHFLAQAKMQLLGRPLRDVDLMVAGDRIDLGDRQLAVIRPPYFDAPETLGFYDPASESLFSVDSFGALSDGVYDSAEAMNSDALFEGMAAWSALDAPWLDMADPARLGAVLAQLARLGPKRVLSSHLAPSRDIGALSQMVLGCVARMQGGVRKAA